MDVFSLRTSLPRRKVIYLEDPLQSEAKLQPRSSGSEQLEQIVPQSQDVVLSGVDSADVVVVFRFQFLGDCDDGRHSFLVRVNVRLDGFVLLGRRLPGRQVEAEIVLKRTLLSIHPHG